MAHVSEIESFLRNFEERAAPIEKAVGEAWWNLATSGTEEAQRELVRAGNEYNNLFSDRSEYEKVQRWHEQRDSLENLLLRRQVEVLYLKFAGSQGDPEVLSHIEELEAEVNAVYSNHRAKVGEEDLGENEIREILATSEDVALRREAWEASKTVGREVEERVRELARLRNQLAREAGHENHYERSLALQEIQEEELLQTMNELETATNTPFQKAKEDLDAKLMARFGTDEILPWHLSDPFFQEAPETGELDPDLYFEGKDLKELTQKTYDLLGLDVRRVMARSDLYERKDKSQHAFCLKVGREYPYDVRVLANVRSDSYWAGTMLHEFGHAAYDSYINPRLPYLLRSISHINTTEAIALMMGALAEEPGWLSYVAGVPQEGLASEKLADRRRLKGLVFVRWTLVMFHFERALYKDPDRDDLNNVWWDLVEKLQLVDRPPGRDEPDWAAKLHVALAPVYYHNYVLGSLIAAQLRNYLESYITRGPFYKNEAAGRYLLESFFGPGARESWQDTVLRATGEGPNPKYFIESLY